MDDGTRGAGLTRRETRWVLGLIAAFFLYVAGVTMLGALPQLLHRNCWEVQVKEGRAFKVDTCRGDVVELPSPSTRKD